MIGSISQSSVPKNNLSPQMIWWVGLRTLSQLEYWFCHPKPRCALICSDSAAGKCDQPKTRRYFSVEVTDWFWRHDFQMFENELYNDLEQRVRSLTFGVSLHLSLEKLFCFFQFSKVWKREVCPTVDALVGHKAAVWVRMCFQLFRS